MFYSAACAGSTYEVKDYGTTNGHIDRPKYRQRNIIERMFGWLKEDRRIVTRFDKIATSFATMVSLACAMRWLRQYFRTEPRTKFT
nr:transposase [Pseudomonas syringae]